MKNLGVIFGGVTCEHDVSIVTGLQLIENVNKSKYNIIPINKIKDGIYEKSSQEKILSFRDRLNEKGIVATVRRELGSDISAACGQLVRQTKQNM